MKKFNSVFCIIILLLCISTLALPQSKTKVKQTVNVISNLMKKCVNNNWMLYGIFFNDKPFMNNNTNGKNLIYQKIVPSTLGKRNQHFRGIFGLDPRSELSRKLIDPLDNEFIRMSSENPEPQDSMNAITLKEREIGGYYVYAYINMKQIEGKKYTGEKIPGAAIITKMNKAYRDSCDWVSYFIGFGNWKNASKSSSGYNYKFKRQSGSHYIQNVVVVMTGLQNRMRELLKDVRWEELNKLVDN